MTQTDISTLADFLLARIAEDERTARGAWINGQRWRFNDRTGAVEVPSDALEWTPTTAYMFAPGASQDDDENGVRTTAMCDGDHIARWDPARVLAECAAKRAIVEGMEPYGPIDDLCAPETLGLLATVYSDHPDYREDWRP